MLSVISIITVILTKEVVMATDGQCADDYQFKSPFLPGESCEAIYNKNTETRDKPGYYWILSREYCGMNYTESSCEDIYNKYPETVGKSGYYHINGSHFCRVVSDGNFVCSSTNFSTNGISYQRVCGRARGYQKRFTDAFYGCNRAGQTIDGYYVEGISITHGNPRQHIWTYASGLLDNQTHSYNCPCAGYCLLLYDPLWDGSGYITSNCCDSPTQPWFYRELNGTTTDDIEARLCKESEYNAGLIMIDQLELYIQ
ncbi:uncharacterized protein [Dysidea avara]|uniref:uncharacterized protein n=1 Tax=Dysidea avara TaxID=196820 RepID=UPI00332ACBD0